MYGKKDRANEIISWQCKNIKRLQRSNFLRDGTKKLILKKMQSG